MVPCVSHEGSQAKDSPLGTLKNIISQEVLLSSQCRVSLRTSVTGDKLITSDTCYKTKQSRAMITTRSLTLQKDPIPQYLKRQSNQLSGTFIC